MYYVCCCLLQSPNWIPVVGVCHCCNFRYVSVSTQKTKTCQWHLNWWRLSLFKINNCTKRTGTGRIANWDSVNTYCRTYSLLTDSEIDCWLDYNHWPWELQRMRRQAIHQSLLLLPNYNMTTNQSHATSSGVGTRSLLIRRITTHLQARPHVSTTMKLWWWSPPPSFHIYSWQNIKYALPIISSLLHRSLILIGFCKLKCQRMEALGAHNDGIVVYSNFFLCKRRRDDKSAWFN